MGPKKSSRNTTQWRDGLTKDIVEGAYSAGASLEDLATRWKTSVASVRRLMRRFGIKRRTLKEAGVLHFGKRDPALSEPQRQLILGSMLGDACWSIGTMRYRDGSVHATTKVCFYHTEKKLAYVEHKHRLLGSGVRIGKALKIGKRTSGHGSVMRGFAFSATRTLQPLLDLLGHPKRVSRAWLDQLTWEGLAYWYQDDGSLGVSSASRFGTVRFYTNGFTYAEQEILRDWLLEFAGLHCRITKSPNGTPDEWILQAHRQTEVYNFLTNIRPFIVPCMKHKIRTWKPHVQPSSATVEQ